MARGPTRRRKTVTTCGIPAQDQRVQLCLTRRADPGQAIQGPEDVCSLLRGAENAAQESFYALLLDAGNRLIGVQEVAKGGISSVDVEPMTLFRGALLSAASRLIVAHNHPSGQATFSEADKQLTERLARAAQMLGIPVLDHVIVAAEGCASFVQQGQLGLKGYEEAPAQAADRPRRRWRCR